MHVQRLTTWKLREMRRQDAKRRDKQMIDYLQGELEWARSELALWSEWWEWEWCISNRWKLAGGEESPIQKQHAERPSENDQRASPIDYSKWEHVGSDEESDSEQTESHDIEESHNDMDDLFAMHLVEEDAIHYKEEQGCMDHLIEEHINQNMEENMFTESVCGDEDLQWAEGPKAAEEEEEGERQEKDLDQTISEFIQKHVRESQAENPPEFVCQVIHAQFIATHQVQKRLQCIEGDLKAQLAVPPEGEEKQRVHEQNKGVLGQIRRVRQESNRVEMQRDLITQRLLHEEHVSEERESYNPCRPHSDRPDTATPSLG